MTGLYFLILIPRLLGRILAFRTAIYIYTHRGKAPQVLQPRTWLRILISSLPPVYTLSPPRPKVHGLRFTVPYNVDSPTYLLKLLTLTPPLPQSSPITGTCLYERHIRKNEAHKLSPLHIDAVSYIACTTRTNDDSRVGTGQHPAPPFRPYIS